MKDIIKTILLFCALICFALSCDPEPDPGKISYTKNDIDTIPFATVEELFKIANDSARVMALRVVAGRDWTEDNKDSLDLYDAMLISQNPTNGRQSRFSLSTLLAFMRDSVTGSQTLSLASNVLTITGGNNVSLSAYLDNTDAQTLSSTSVGDSISVTGGNKIEIPFRVYGVDDKSDIYSRSFPLNARVVDRSTGSNYKIQSTEISGYTTDSIFVIPSGSNYAVLQPVGSSVRFSDVNQVGNDDTEVFTKMANFAAAQSNITQLLIDQTMYLTDSVRLPSGISMIGNNNNERVRTLTKYQRIIIDLNDAGKTAIALEDHQFGGGDQYAPGGTISNLNFEVISDCNAVIELIRPGWVTIDNIMIHSGPVPANYTTKYANYGIMSGQSLKLSVSNIEILGAKKYGWYSYRGSAGSTTSYWRNVRLAYCNNAALLESIDLNVDNLIVESIDSVGIVLAKGSKLNVSGMHTENIPSALGPSPIFDIQNGSINIQWGSIASAPGHGMESIRVDTSIYVRLKDLGFANAYQSITTTDQSGYVVFDNVGERNRKVFSDLYGITKPEKLTVIGGYTNFTYENPTSILPDVDIVNEDVSVSDVDSLQVYSDMTIYNDTVRMIGAYNLFKRSEELNNTTTWQLPGTDIWTVTANDTIAPDGATTADLITYNLPGSYAQNTEVVPSLILGEAYTFSFYARKSLGNPQLRVFILQTGTDPEETIDIVGDWKRYSVTLTPTATISAIGFSLPAGAGNNFHLWGMQVVKGTVPGVYVQTDNVSNKPTGEVKIKGNTKFLNAITLGPVSQPSNPDTGSVYVSTAGNLNFYNGALWVELGGGISDYGVVADSVGNYLNTTLTKTLKANTTTQLGGFNWYVDDATGGNMVVGSGSYTGRGKMEVIGGNVYTSNNFVLANGQNLQAYSSAAVLKNVITFSSTDNIVIGDGTGNLNDIYLTSGSASDDDIYFRTGGTNIRMQIKGTGDIVIFSPKVNASSLPTYADDTAAGSGGLVSGDLYKTSTGEVRIKL